MYLEEEKKETKKKISQEGIKQQRTYGLIM